LHCGDTTTLVEANLPHTRQIGQQVPNALAIPHVPHLKRAVGAGDDFLPVVLEAGDCAGVRTKRRLASTGLRVPDAQRTVCGSGDETVMAEVQKADKRGVAFEVKEASARVEIPHLDEVVHAA
jgi:hypothetical protein